MGQEKWDEPIAAHLQTCFTAAILFPVTLLKQNSTFTLYTYFLPWMLKRVCSFRSDSDSSGGGDRTADPLIMRLLHLLSQCSFFINSDCGGKRGEKKGFHHVKHTKWGSLWWTLRSATDGEEPQVFGFKEEPDDPSLLSPSPSSLLSTAAFADLRPRCFPAKQSPVNTRVPHWFSPQTRLHFQLSLATINILDAAAHKSHFHTDSGQRWRRETPAHSIRACCASEVQSEAETVPSRLSVWV